MNLKDINDIIRTPVSTLAEMSGDSLFRLKTEVSDQLAITKALNEHIDNVLDYRYGERAQQHRLDAGKDTGVVHFDDGEVRISAKLPKRITWDQKQLTEIARRLADGGEDPTQYIDIRYNVPEKIYEKLPSAWLPSFARARTLKTGKPTFTLALLGEAQS